MTTSSSSTSHQSAQVSFRQLSTAEEYLGCVELQKETWGGDFGDIVPASILKVSQKVGGITAGAFDENGTLLGFVYGLSGIKDGQLVHWSHMLAVKKDARGLGLGKKLKLYQRELLLARGVRTAYWTFDPLVARNASLNLSALGAVITEYVKDMYIDSSSDLHRGLGMDRFIVSWHLNDERVSKAIEGKAEIDIHRFSQASVVNTRKQNGSTLLPVDVEFSSSKSVRVEVPPDIESVQASSLLLASQWRANTRRVFLWYLQHGYSVVDFYIDAGTGGCFYCLEHH